ncbi:hypothetical protein ACPPVU_06120 [Mucilaginibacter sp. McL0603]|uniref:hypothetical protein n=1 Tax=Mucilaginibacter sp. McL0603 TaxID=3415670 RepID=UPI003CF3C663
MTFLGISSCKPQSHGSVWTKEYEQNAYNDIYKGSSNVIKDTVQRRQFALYVVKKLKLELPNGTESVSADSLQRVFAKAGAEYAESNDSNNFTMDVPWTTSGEKILRESLFNSPTLQKLDKNLKSKYCDCLILKLKETNPNSMLLPSDSTFLKLINQCKTKIGTK